MQQLYFRYMTSFSSRQKSILVALSVLAAGTAGAYCSLVLFFPTNAERAESSSQVSSTGATSTNNATGEATKTFNATDRLVFSADFASGTPCHDRDTAGCQVFSALLDHDTGAVQQVSLLSATTNDQFPELSPDGSFATYMHSDATRDTAMLYRFANGTTQTIAENANHPYPSADSESVYYTLTHGFALASARLDDLGHPLLTGIASAHEPHVSAEGNVSYYTSSGAGSAQPMVYFPATKTSVKASDVGAAHCFWNTTGSLVYCNDRDHGGIISHTVQNGVIGPDVVAFSFPTASALAADDPAFSDPSCVATSLEYGSFCDADHLMLTAGCYERTGTALQEKFTTIMMEDLSTKTLLPVGMNAAAAYGTPSATLWTASCAPLQ